MDKEFKDMIKELKKLCEIGEEILDGDKSSKVNFIGSKLKEAYKRPAKISIDKKSGGEATCHIEGDALAILVALAGLKKFVLEKTDTSTELYELIEKCFGVKEVDQDE